jgi:hypothetical protein
MTTQQRQGKLPFEYEAEPDGDEVTAWAGLPLIVELMRQLGLERHARQLKLRQRNAGFSEFELLIAFVLLLAAGGDCLDDVRMLREDKALCTLLGHQLPSADTMRRTLEMFHDPELMKQRETHDGAAWIAPESERLQALAHLSCRLVHGVAINESEPVTCATIDYDATIIESRKREALAHYEGGRGYQPVAALWAETGLVVADQFRDGNVPAGMGNLPLIQRAFEALPPTVTQRFFRADSACYEEKLLKWLAKEKIGFAISADMTPELRRQCVALAEKDWALFEERADISVHLAEVEFTPGDWPRSAAPLRYLALRFTPKQQALFRDGSEVKYFATVTNRDGEAADILEWHRKKAGTIELLHDVTKNELGAGVLPSGKFGAHAAWYRLTLFTHNVLVALKRLALPPDLRLARPKRLRLRVLALGAKVVSHARRLIARVSAAVLYAADILSARNRVASLVPT